MPSGTFEASTSKPFDVVIVPFPFSDSHRSKRRPALVLSDPHRFNIPAGHTLLAMITTAKATQWPLDVPLQKPGSAGLPQDCFVRMKLFTLDNRVIDERLGRLYELDQKQVQKALRMLIYS